MGDRWINDTSSIHNETLHIFSEKKFFISVAENIEMCSNSKQNSRRKFSLSGDSHINIKSLL